jgi:tRNA pseudouridine55 synthase
MKSGLVVVDKPPGWTSHDVVARLRRVYGQRRVGHAGTLDPDATGVLLVGLGRVTRLLRFLQVATKEYRGEVVFGVATTTLDAAGEVVGRRPMPCTREQVVGATRAFVGDIEQIPPMVSAVKVGGRRLHELARRGEVVERAPRRVRIDRLVVDAFVPGSYPVATLHVECSSGTFVRTLAADLGAALGGYAHLASLRRLRVGSFGESESHRVSELEADPDAGLLSTLEAMRDLERLVVGEADATGVTHGLTVAGEVADAAGLGDGPFAVIDRSGELLGVYERRGSALRPAVVLAPANATAGRE